MIAALFVATDGCYFGDPSIDPWDEQRDARKYPGPHPVVAHPPCERWGRYWSGGPMLANTPAAKKLGDDHGCFLSALTSVRTWGGVLEHPEASHAWRIYGLNRPPRSGSWIKADDYGGWTCCVEQGGYGHTARKATWLYAARCTLPDLKWGKTPGDFVRLDAGFHSIEERRRAIKTGACQRLSKRQCAATPPAFKDVLVTMARSVQP